MRLVTLAFFLVALAAAGCGTAKGAYRAGMEYEQAGEYEQAAYAYYKALKRDPSLDNVRGRLEIAGREAVRQLLQQAGSMSSAPDVADAYLAADRLMRTVTEVGVELDRPDTFIQDIARHFAAAIDELLEDADAMIEMGGYSDALRQIDRAAGYFPTRPNQERIADLTLRTRLEWSESELASGSFRGALTQLDAALPLVIEGSPTWDEVQDRRASVIDAGTVVVAVFPTEAERVSTDMPGSLLRDVDDVVADELYRDPTPFLDFVNPAEIRRLLRDARNTNERMDNPRVTGALTRDLGADFGMALEVGTYRESEREVRRRDRTTDRTGGGRATYQRVTREIELKADAAIRLVDDAGRRLDCTADDIPQRVTQRYDVGEFDGDWRDLDLSRSDRALFSDQERDDARDRAIRELRDELGRAMSDAIASCLARQIP